MCASFHQKRPFFVVPKEIGSLVTLHNSSVVGQNQGGTCVYVSDPF